MGRLTAIDTTLFRRATWNYIQVGVNLDEWEDWFVLRGSGSHTFHFDSVAISNLKRQNLPLPTDCSVLVWFGSWSEVKNFWFGSGFGKTIRIHPPLPNMILRYRYPVRRGASFMTVKLFFFYTCCRLVVVSPVPYFRSEIFSSREWNVLTLRIAVRIHF